MEDADLAIVLARQTDQTVTATMRLTVPGSRAPAILADRIPIVVDQSILLELYLDTDAYGRRLSAMLFAGACLGGALRRARDVAKQAGRHLRVRLCLDPTDDTLAAIRWETLRDPEDDAPLALSNQILFARCLESADLTPVRLSTPAHLRALVIISSPRNLGSYNLATLDIEGEVVRSSLALAGLRPTLIARTQQRPASLAQIDLALRDNPQIVYLICHGTERGGETVLWLEHEDGSAAPTSGRMLVELIAGMCQRPLLVVLTACRSAGSGATTGALSALGPQLARAGVAAVVAPQGDLPQPTAAAFMPALFRQLFRDGRIDTAMAPGGCRRSTCVRWTVCSGRSRQRPIRLLARSPTVPSISKRSPRPILPAYRARCCARGLGSAP